MSEENPSSTPESSPPPPPAEAPPQPERDPGKPPPRRSRLWTAIRKRPMSILVYLLVPASVAFGINLWLVLDGIQKWDGSTTFALPNQKFVWMDAKFESKSDQTYVLDGKTVPVKVIPIVAANKHLANHLGFWGMLGITISGFIGYSRVAGLRSVFQGILEIPASLVRIFVQPSGLPTAAFLWGMAGGILGFAGVHPWYRILGGVIFLTLAFSCVPRVVNSLANRIRGDLDGVAPMGGFAGFCAGLSLSALLFPTLVSPSLKLALAIGAIAWLLMRSGGVSKASPAVWMICLALLVFLFPELAWAHDGGPGDRGTPGGAMVEDEGALAAVGSSGAAAATSGMAGGLGGIGGEMLGRAREGFLGRNVA